MHKNHTQKQQNIWFIFRDESNLWFLKFLKKGFRHCFALIEEDGRWMSIDPMAHLLQIENHADLPPGYDLPRWLRQKGGYVIRYEGEITPNVKPAPVSLLNCVEVMKRLIGIHNRWILTPYQFYKYLKRQSQTSTQKGDG